MLGNSITVTMTDPIEGVVYTSTQSGIETSGITDPYLYTFEPIVRKTDILFNDLPFYANTTVTVTLTGSTGETVLCGLCCIGKSFNAGTNVRGMTLGIQDYSAKTQDDYGNYSITEREYSRKATMTLLVDRRRVDALHNLLVSYRATPAVYIGSDQYGSSFVFGFFKDFNIEIPYPFHSFCSIELESLI